MVDGEEIRTRVGEGQIRQSVVHIVASIPYLLIHVYLSSLLDNCIWMFGSIILSYRVDSLLIFQVKFYL